MNAFFHHLSSVYEAGHREEIPDLLSDARFADADRNAEAAVLIAVTDRAQADGGPGVILTQRPQGMRDHPGQVAFPGGKLDPGENPIEAALREAEEELALDRGHVRIIGETDRYQTGTGFNVTPVLGVIPPDLTFSPNPGEVEAWFEAPLSLLLARENWQRQEVFWQGAMRGYLELHFEGFRIWGVTAAIIANLSRRITPERLFDGS
ncbi:MAG: CoA pyrophosphatase [Erythrobacter sp.]